MRKPYMFTDDLDFDPYDPETLTMQEMHRLLLVKAAEAAQARAAEPRLVVVSIDDPDLSALTQALKAEHFLIAGVDYERLERKAAGLADDSDTEEIKARLNRVINSGRYSMGSEVEPRLGEDPPPWRASEIVRDVILPGGSLSFAHEPGTRGGLSITHTPLMVHRVPLHPEPIAKCPEEKRPKKQMTTQRQDACVSAYDRHLQRKKKLPRPVKR